MPRRHDPHRAADDAAAQVLGDRTDGLAPGVNPSSFTHRFRMENRIQQGQPHFAHWLHIILSTVTAGAWLPIYWLSWMLSARRRYQRLRRRQLVDAGLL